MQVTNEIRHAFLYAMWTETLSPVAFEYYLTVAFEARESEELLCWMTIYEKIKFGQKLLELTAVNWTERTLETDLTEDR